MLERVPYALRRAALLYALVAAPLAALGVIWAVTAHHSVGFAVPVLLYIAAGVLAMGGTFAKSNSRKEYLLLTIEQRRESFTTHMWLLAVAVALGVTAAALQLLF